MRLPSTDAILKIEHDLKTLFNVEEFIAEHEHVDGAVRSRLLFDDKIFEIEGKINPKELLRAEIHRLIKKNLYSIFVGELGRAPAPYGIMDGVRPTMRLPSTDAILKIEHDLKTLFNVEEFIAEHEHVDGAVRSRLLFDDKIFETEGKINPKELLRAEIHRLIKKNLYSIFVDELKKNPAPYGIMDGVRPTKIIHRWLRAGLDRSAIIERLTTEYLVSDRKARLLMEVAERQLPILASTDERTIGIYIGIPFCVTRCLYCSFPSNVLPDRKKIDEFMSALERDIQSARSDVERYNFRVQSIYVGGGTPTSLPDDLFERLLDWTVESFDGRHVEEFTVECGRPDTITPSKIESMKKFGVSRVSVNPQSMQQRTLDRIGRRHSPDDIIRAFHDLRAASDWKINMDMILGLPGERLDDVIDSLEKVLALEPDDVTLHALALKRGSRLQAALDDEGRSLSEFNLPSDAEVRSMADQSEIRLRAQKYEPYYLYRQGYMSGQIENVGWCRAGAEGIYNVQIMDERQTIIGIGGAASTKVEDKKNARLLSSFHPKDLLTYLRDIDHYVEKRSALLKSVYGD